MNRRPEPDTRPVTGPHPVDLPARLRTRVARWGLVGTLMILLNAVLRLAPIAWEPVAAGDLDGPRTAALLGTVALFAWMEGWRGFHLRFSPRAVARAAHVTTAPTWVRVLAPLACMGLVWASTRRLVASWMLLAMIVGVVVAVRLLPYPWRAIVDAGVVVGLSVGIVSIVWHLAAGLRGQLVPIDPDLPEGAVDPVA